MENLDFERDRISERLYRIYSESEVKLFQQLQRIIAPHANRLADLFYTNLLNIPESEPFLNHQLVSKRLHRSMAEWIEDLFLPKDEEAVTEHMSRQRVIGQVHARINVPIKLVNHGIRLHKAEIGKILSGSDLDETQKYQALLLVNDLIDYSSALINESYITNQMENETETQSLRMHVLSIPLVVELERLRSSLFDWLRKTIVSIYENYPEEYPALPSFFHSDFGLWAIYKAELLFYDYPELTEELRSQLTNVQNSIERINQLKGEDAKKELSRAIGSLDEHISRVAWLLGDFASHTYEMEAGRDPLTRLFNRRFLPAVMQNMIKASRATSSQFSVLSCDLDGFKEINDRHGHDVGDKTLTAFGDFLASQVRATDYIFRLGGDEFLMVLAGADAEIGAKVAKKILSHLDQRRFNLDNEISTRLWMSIGIAEFDGHPDYLHLLNRADEALYKAKSIGKRKYFVQSAVAT